MSDILLDLFIQYPFKDGQIRTTANGEKCFAIMLSNGNIGICSNLDSTPIDEPTETILANPNFSNYAHRIVANAWINACANYLETVNGNNDISEVVNFNAYENVVMIGYFGSLATKLENKQVNLTIFDLKEDDKPVEPMAKQLNAVRAADCIILTSTSITNNTYINLFSNSIPGCKIYLLGPSTPINNTLFNLPNVFGLFGSRFKPFDLEMLKSIEQGGGTRSFLGRMEKVYLLKHNNH